MVYTLNWGQLNCQGDDCGPASANRLDFNNLQLDIVGFLAILGEEAVKSTSQVATLSRMIFVPRLLPAPQALLRPTRPDNLSPIPGQVVGVTSGNIRSYVNFLGHVLANADSLPDYAVKCIEIKRKDNQGEVRARTLGPTWWVATLGLTLSVALFAIALTQHDGMAILADVCLSFLSTLVGIVNKWKLNLPKRAGDKNNWTPPADVIIRYPKGSFVVVKCSEDVARELFFAPEGIDYDVAAPWKYRMIALLGSILLMFGVIFLGNAGTNSQVAFAVAYMILNAAYWVIAALPQKFHWDLSAFEVLPEAFDEPDAPSPEQLVKEGAYDRLKDVPKGYPPLYQRKSYVSYNKTFTEALWKVIVATREIDWIEQSGTAPQTVAWKEWLNDAYKKAKEAPRPKSEKKKRGRHHVDDVQLYNVPDWNPQKALISALRAAKEAENKKAEQKTAPDRVDSQPPPEKADCADVV